MAKIETSDSRFLIVKYNDGTARVELITTNNIPIYLRSGYEIIVWNTPQDIEHAQNYLSGKMTYEDLCAKNILVHSNCPIIDKEEK